MKYLIFYIFLLSRLSVPAIVEPEPDKSLLKEAAFAILESKCNTCHQTDNTDRVFTMDNMNKNAKRVKRQVFIFKRMPKGNMIKLTKEEKQTLKSWIKSL